uniref:alpha/beta hydrolase family protein n=1 Tax=uncultured Draconibacterium sp. TaxID=1573823 RepID=UPI003216AEA4
MNNILSRFPLYLILALLIFVSCDNGMDDVEIPSENEYLVSSDPVATYQKESITTYIALAKLLYPDQADELDQLLIYVETGVQVYKIVYNTQFKGETVQASGIVCFPDQPGSYPILSYQNGTNTLHSAAPTVDDDNKLFQILEMMGSTGFIITLPDYLGFGESENMFHPYLHKESTVQSLVDMLRAVKEMTEEQQDIDFNNDLYISGYSQGGWATMALQQAIETNYSSEFNLQASACGAGPYNLTTINEYVTGLTEYPMPYFLGYIFNSYLELDLSTPIEDVIQAPYAALIPELYDGTKDGDAINDLLTTSMPDFFTADYISNWATDTKFKNLTDMLAENSVEAWATTTPTLILHGTADMFVPLMVSTDIYADFIAAGTSNNLIEFVPLEGLNHSGGIVPSGLASLKWFIQLKDNAL